MPRKKTTELPEAVVPTPDLTPESKPARKPRATAQSESKKPAHATSKSLNATPKASVAKASLSPAPKKSVPKRATTPKVKSDPALEEAALEFNLTFRPRQELPVTGGAAAPGQQRPANSRRRGREKVVAVAAPTVVHSEFQVESDDLPIPAWRSKTANGQKPVSKATETKPVRESRRGRREEPRDRTPEETPTPQVPAGPVEMPQANFRRKEKRTLLPPPKPLIPTPADAPQIAMRDGVPTLVRNGRVYPPFFFFGGSTDERSANTVLDELKMASEAGIHLHSHLIDFEVAEDAVDSNVKLAAYHLKKSRDIDSESQVLFRLVFKAPRNWQQTYPNARYLHEDGTLAEPSVCDDEFWNVAKKCLSEFVQQLLKLDLAKHILGVQLDRGEWFIADGWGYDTSEAATRKFREWSKVRYLDDDVMLRASWFDGASSFDQLTIPLYSPEGDEGERFVRSSRKQRRYVDYHLFLSDAIVNRIGDLAYTAKEASQGSFIVGASYGYTFEWSHPGSGHLSLGKLLRTPELDFIAGPPSYRSREPGGAAPFPGPIDSFSLNGKLYLSEEDFKTSLSGGREPDDFNPMIKTPQALESVHWRGAGAALAHGSGVSWMDLWGNGWLKTTSIWDRASKVADSFTYRMGAGIGEPEVCVFIDERALAYLVDQNAFSLLVQNVRESVLRAGVNAGFYLLSDLAHREKFPEAKAYIFLNAWDIRPDLRAAIKSRLQRDGKHLFWLYSAGLFDAGRDSLERAREVTGIALKPQPFYSKSGTTILNRRHPLCEAFPDRSLVSGAKLEPSYFAIPEEALVLGEYTQTGLPSFVVKEFNSESDDQKWTSIFLGEPSVNPALIRALAQMSGAHVWNFGEDVVHVRPPFLTIHCTGTGPRAIALPSKWIAYNLLNQQWVQTDSTNLRFQANDGSTQVFLVGEREEIEHLLQMDPNEVLTMSELPPKLDNTLTGDASSFDIPIMKLNEWMEGGDADEVADEWFLRPQHIHEEAPPVDSAEPALDGNRRRRSRRRRGGDRQGSEETAGVRQEFRDSPNDDLGVNVVFRKRS
jgi:hypothetical protein